MNGQVDLLHFLAAILTNTFVHVSYRCFLDFVCELLLPVRKCMSHIKRDPNLPIHFVDVRRQSARFFTSFRDKFLDIIFTLVTIPGCGVIRGSGAGKRMEHKSCIKSLHLIYHS